MMKDKYLLITSFFIAIFLWLYVFSNENSEAIIQVPVRIIETRDNTMAQVSPTEVTIKVRGQRTLIYSSAHEKLSIDLNVSDYPIGTSAVRLAPTDIRITGAEVLEITPSRLDLSVHETVTKRINIQPLLSGQPSRGYKVSGIEATPPSVDVEGIPEYVNQLTAIQTKSISIDGIDNTTSFVITPAEYTGIKRIEPNEISVKVNIEENIISQNFNSKVDCINGSTNLEELLPIVVATVKGRSDMLDEISFPSTYLVEADCTSLNTPGDHQITLLPRQFDHFEVTDIRPSVITVNTSIIEQ